MEQKNILCHISWRNQLLWRTIRACFFSEWFLKVFRMLTQVLNNCLVYLLGICYFLNMSWWCVAFPITGWGSSLNVITEAWSEKEENRKMFPINQNAYPSNSSITQLWSDKRKEKMKSGRLILTEYTWGNGWKCLI